MFTHCLVNLNVHIAAKTVLIGACPRGLKFSAYLVMIVGYYVTVVICCVTFLSQVTDHVKSTNYDTYAKFYPLKINSLYAATGIINNTAGCKHKRVKMTSKTLKPFFSSRSNCEL